MAKKIKVIFPNHVGHVDPDELDELIKSGKIMAFERENKLVVVGIHPTRQRQTGNFHRERRKSGEKKT